MGMVSFDSAKAQSMKSLQCAEERIRSIVSRSMVPEDPLHAERTLAWVLKLRPEADEALQLAALGHDIDRAIETRRVRKDHFENFDEFKAAHALNSGVILEEILKECGVNGRIRVEACRLVRLHEIGGDERSDILKNADSLSYFEDNLPLYYARNGLAKSKQRSLWGFERLSPYLRPIVARISYDSEELNTLIREVVTEAEQGSRDWSQR
jgi:hypothetical protein